MDYIKVSKAAENWGISPRRVRILCAEGKIPGVIRNGKLLILHINDTWSHGKLVSYYDYVKVNTAIATCISIAILVISCLIRL